MPKKKLKYLTPKKVGGCCSKFENIQSAAKDIEGILGCLSKHFSLSISDVIMAVDLAKQNILIKSYERFMKQEKRKCPSK